LSISRLYRGAVGFRKSSNNVYGEQELQKEVLAIDKFVEREGAAG
jgi:hypothetical protein